jgi:hypothetical protein
VRKLLDRDRLPEISRLINLGAPRQGDAVGEQLQRNVEQDRVELGLGSRYFEQAVGRYLVCGSMSASGPCLSSEAGYAFAWAASSSPGSAMLGASIA